MPENTEEEIEYIDVDIEEEIAKATTKIYEEMSGLQEKMNNIMEQLRQHDRRVEAVENTQKRADSPMIEISANDVTEAVARLLVDRMVRPVPVKVVPIESRKTKIPE